MDLWAFIARSLLILSAAHGHTAHRPSSAAPAFGCGLGPAVGPTEGAGIKVPASRRTRPAVAPASCASGHLKAECDQHGAERAQAPKASLRRWPSANRKEPFRTNSTEKHVYCVRPLRFGGFPLNSEPRLPHTEPLFVTHTTWHLCRYTREAKYRKTCL